MTNNIKEAAESISRDLPKQMESKGPQQIQQSIIPYLFLLDIFLCVAIFLCIPLVTKKTQQQALIHDSMPNVLNLSYYLCLSV